MQIKELAVRSEEEPYFYAPSLGGNIYIVDEMYRYDNIPFIFLAVNEQDDLYIFNLATVKKKDYVEYVVFKITLKEILRANTLDTTALDIMKDKSICIYMIDKGGEEVLLNYTLDTIPKDYLPRENTHFSFNMDKIRMLYARYMPNKE